MYARDYYNLHQYFKSQPHIYEFIPYHPGQGDQLDKHFTTYPEIWSSLSRDMKRLKSDNGAKSRRGCSFSSHNGGNTSGRVGWMDSSHILIWVRCKKIQTFGDLAIQNFYF